MYIQILLSISIWFVAGWAQWETTIVTLSLFSLLESNWFQFYLSAVIFFSSQNYVCILLKAIEALEKLRGVREDVPEVFISFFLLSQAYLFFGGDFQFESSKQGLRLFCKREKNSIWISSKLSCFLDRLMTLFLPNLSPLLHYQECRMPDITSLPLPILSSSCNLDLNTP